MLNPIVYHVAMLAVDFLLLKSICRHDPTPLWRLLWLAFLGGSAACVLAIGDGRLVSHGLAWHGGGFLSASAVLLFRQRVSEKRRIMLSCGIALLAAVYIGLCIDALFIEPTALEVRHHVIKTNKITKPLRILFMADLQTDCVGEYERRTLLLAKKQNADLILLGGDYLQTKNEEQEMEQVIMLNKLLKEVDLNAPLGVYAVKGNQEIGRQFDWKRYFSGTRIIPVEKTVQIDVGEIRLTLLEMYSSFIPRQYPDRHRGDKFRIILGHCPCFALTAQDADLLLAGHTHGGQIWIPGFGPLFTMSRGLPRRWASGMTVLPNGSRLLISNGTGMERGSAPRVRFNCRPDIRIIDLIPESGGTDTGH